MRLGLRKNLCYVLLILLTVACSDPNRQGSNAPSYSAAEKPSAATPSSLRGDWVSAGDFPIEPYVPDYEFLYHCELHLQQPLAYNNEGHTLIAVAEAAINKEQTFIYSSALKWSVHLNKHNGQVPKPTQAELEFATDGQYIGMHFDRTKAGQSDQVTLIATVSQRFGPYEFSSSEAINGSRDDELLKVSVDLSLRNLESENVYEPGMRLDVWCEKKL